MSVKLKLISVSGACILSIVAYLKFWGVDSINSDSSTMMQRRSITDDGALSLSKTQIEVRLARLEQQLTASNQRYENLRHDVRELSDLIKTTGLVLEDLQSIAGNSEGNLHDSHLPVLDDNALLLQQKTAFNKEFTRIHDIVLAETVDEAWRTQMTQSLQGVETRLQQLGLQGTQLVSQDCRSTACVVVFTHENEINDSTMPIALAAKGARSVLTKKVHDGDVIQTVAIYRRDPER